MESSSPAGPPDDAIEPVSAGLGLPARQVRSVVALLDAGNTIPFIARYRKEVTGGLDDAQLRTLEERLGYLRELEERRRTVLASIDEQGRLTDGVRAQVMAAETKARLEDIYLHLVRAAGADMRDDEEALA